MADRKVRDDDDDNDDDGISGEPRASSSSSYPHVGWQLLRRVNLCVATFLDPPTSSTSAAGNGDVDDDDDDGSVCLKVTNCVSSLGI